MCAEPEKRHDVIKELIEKMNKFSDGEKFEQAKKVLDEIGTDLQCTVPGEAKAIMFQQILGY